MGFIDIQKKNSYALVTIKRPEALNALNDQVISDISIAIDEMERDKHLRAFILTGEGKAFVAGADIAKMQTFSEPQGRDFSELGQKVFRKLELSPLVSIAALNGFALGGGLELALSCDIRYASSSAKLGLPEVSLGLLPGFGGSQRLPRLIGVGRASELIFTGDMISAEEAYRLGIVNKITSAEDLLQESEKLIQTILTRGPNAIRAAKMAIRQGLEGNLERGIEWERQLFGGRFSDPETKEGLGAFLEKRKPNFGG
ncbi:enoyl-CoA hydratase/isomerase family protein [Leptospira ryugenii]|uniref:Enoyl-CoA hydratase/isomerase family protein n=1 Tax=Leptospira ryugenii TaxID=1917863 RepID=A0A2P2E0X6_9LEPT|nr:enoyl-CoA hydratase-related protein [Leptospira ryugenii]GBF50529.1 enoyl-CoA hydratase/isomerase family protein [Leptospira ryugenii]